MERARPPGEAGAPGQPGEKGDRGDKSDQGDPGPSEGRVRGQGQVDDLPEPPFPFTFEFRTIVQVPLPAGTYVLMARGTVLMGETDLRGSGECNLRFED